MSLLKRKQTKRKQTKIKQTEIFYVLDRENDKIFFSLEKITENPFSSNATIKIPRYGDFSMEPLLVSDAFKRNNYYRLTNTYSNAIHDKVFQKEIDKAMNIIRIALPPIKN